MLNLIQAAVIEKEELEYLIKDGFYTSLEDLNFQDAQGGDYSQTALVDKDDKYVLYWEDNIHGNPRDYLNGFIRALVYLDIDHTIEKLVMNYDELKTYDGKKYR